MAISPQSFFRFADRHYSLLIDLFYRSTGQTEADLRDLIEASHSEGDPGSATVFNQLVSFGIIEPIPDATATFELTAPIRSLLSFLLREHRLTSAKQGPLHDFTPCLFAEREEIIHAVAVVHTELVLIHPFREGNGRLARMFAVLMGLQAGLPPFDYGGLKGKTRQKYFAAVQAGMEYNYEPMETIFRNVLKRSLRQA